MERLFVSNLNQANFLFLWCNGCCPCYSKVSEIEVTSGNTATSVSLSSHAFRKQRIQGKNWVFTDFELLDWAEYFFEFGDVIRFLAFAKEVCPNTQKVHFQGIDRRTPSSPMLSDGGEFVCRFRLFQR